MRGGQGHGRKVASATQESNEQRLASTPKSLYGPKASQMAVCHCILLEMLGDTSPLGTITFQAVNGQ
jgi:hypothetical protein